MRLNSANCEHTQRPNCRRSDERRCGRTSSMYFTCTAFSSSPRTCFCASSAIARKAEKDEYETEKGTKRGRHLCAHQSVAPLPPLPPPPPRVPLCDSSGSHTSLQGLPAPG